MNRNLADDERNATNTDARFGRADSAEIPGGFYGQIVPDRKARFALASREAFGAKATFAIVQYSGCPERTARNWMSLHSSPPIEVSGDLLDGDEGDKFFLSYMRLGPRPAWFRRIEHALAILTAIEGVNHGSGKAP